MPDHSKQVAFARSKAAEKGGGGGVYLCVCVCVCIRQRLRRKEWTGRRPEDLVLEYCKFFFFFFPFFASLFSPVSFSASLFFRRYMCVVSFSLFETLFFFNAISYFFQSDLAKE